ncbi:MAG: radical SAM protein [bacterium]
MKKIVREKYNIFLAGGSEAVARKAAELADEKTVSLVKKNSQVDFVYVLDVSEEGRWAMEKAAAEGVPLIAAPEAFSSEQEISTFAAQAEGRGAQFMAGHTLLFAPGFLKIFVAIQRGIIGDVSSAQVKIFVSPIDKEQIENVYHELLSAVYLARKIAGAEAEKSHCEVLPMEYSPAWLEADILFSNGVHGEIELLPPRGEGDGTAVELVVEGSGGKFHWYYSPHGETLHHIQNGVRRGVPVARSSPEVQEVRSMTDFLRRGIAPFETAADGIACAELCKNLIHDAKERTAKKNLKVLLVHVPRYRIIGDELFIPALGIARLTAYLHEFGYDARQTDLDPYFRGRQTELDVFNNEDAVQKYLVGGELDGRLAKALDALKKLYEFDEYDLIGFSIIDFYLRFQLNIALSLAKRIKERNPNTTVVLGGVADEIRTDDTLKRFPHIVDFVIEGDGETAIRKLANFLEHRDRLTRNIPNICFAGDGRVVKNRQVILKLRRRPCPTFDGMPMELYRRTISPQLRQTLIEDNLLAPDEKPQILYLPYYNVKGCAYKCLFCGFQYFLDMQSVEKTARELKRLSEQYQTNYFFLWNTTINMTYKYLDELCDAIIAENLNILWSDSARPQYVDPPLAQKMARAGCILLNFGLESASNKILKIIRKGFTAEEAEASLRAIHDAGIMTRVNLIAGFFHEQDEDIKATCDFLERNAECVDMIGCFNAFYWNEGVVVDVEQIGLRLRPNKGTIPTGQESIAYDEIGGYTWEEKTVAMARCKDDVLKCIRRNNIFYETAVDEYDMFYLFSKFRDLKTVKKYLFGATPSTSDIRVNPSERVTP